MVATNPLSSNAYRERLGRLAKLTKLPDMPPNG